MKIKFEVMMDNDGEKVPVFRLDKYLFAFVFSEDETVMCRDNWAGSINYLDPIGTKITPEEEERALEVLKKPESLETIKEFIAKQTGDDGRPRLTKERKHTLAEVHFADQKTMLEGLRQDGL